MIYAEKGPEPACLPALRGTPGADWGSVHGDQKAEIRGALIRDQGALCAYCQRRIHADEYMGIDHIQPRSAGGAAFVWANLAGACDGGPLGETCDIAKGNDVLLLGPCPPGPDPRDHLRYTRGGFVEADDERARQDIDTLSLQADHLLRSRRAVLDGVRRWMQRREPGRDALQRRVQQLEELDGEAPEFAFVEVYHLRRWLRAR